VVADGVTRGIGGWNNERGELELRAPAVVVMANRGEGRG
jgi:hypothetical protein